MDIPAQLTCVEHRCYGPVGLPLETGHSPQRHSRLLCWGPPKSRHLEPRANKAPDTLLLLIKPRKHGSTAGLHSQTPCDLNTCTTATCQPKCFGRHSQWTPKERKGRALISCA